VAAAALLVEAFAVQRERVFLWVPVAFACGIGAYFSLLFEPGFMLLGLAVACAVTLAGAALLTPRFAPFLVLTVVILSGFLTAAVRSHLVAGPVLEWRSYGSVQGRIIHMDKSASDAKRLTLDRLVMARLPLANTPRRVRVSLHGDVAEQDTEHSALEIGQTVLLSANMSPPNGPVEPEGFDFRRHALFLKLGGFGYTRTEVLTLLPAGRSGVALFTSALRQEISQAVQRDMAPELCAFATAVTTGDRSAMPQEVLQNIRRTNLAHLLAISGLHMGLLTGFVFALVRGGLALTPSLALRLPTKKIAAVVAMVAGAVYLAISGGSVATERAFVMALVMLLAVVLDERVLSLRSVATAALIVLVLRPEALVGPGFQMSFAATIALMVASRVLKDHSIAWLERRSRFVKSVAGVVIISAVAGLATAPVAAAHFNQFVHVGLFANVIAVPVMGASVIPGAVLSALLAPIGLG
jgi:competence protein ComEC